MRHKPVYSRKDVCLLVGASPPVHEWRRRRRGPHLPQPIAVFCFHVVPFLPVSSAPQVFRTAKPNIPDHHYQTVFTLALTTSTLATDGCSKLAGSKVRGTHAAYDIQSLRKRDATTQKQCAVTAEIERHIVGTRLHLWAQAPQNIV